jgi:hypothetical protein
VFFIDYLQLFSYICPLQHTVIKIAYKRCEVYVRDTEFVPEFDVSSEIEIQSNENSTQEYDRNDCQGVKIEHNLITLEI